MPDTYTFRIRFNRSPGGTIDCIDNEIQLKSTHAQALITFRNQEPEKPLRDATNFVLRGSGYSNQAEALAAGENFKSAALVALARVRVGVDFGDRATQGAFTEAGLMRVEQLSGQRTLNDFHGLMAYPCAITPSFVKTNFQLGYAVATESFESAMQAAIAAQIVLTERERLAFTLFNASFFRQTADSRFLLLAMAIEALIEPATRSAESSSHVEALIALTKSASLPRAERDSMIGTLKWLSKESITQAGKRLVLSRLGERQYNGQAAPAFFSRVYSERSNLVHGNLPYPSLSSVGALAATLEVFVSDLLTSPFIGLPD